MLRHSSKENVSPGDPGGREQEGQQRQGGLMLDWLHSGDEVRAGRPMGLTLPVSSSWLRRV